MKIPVYRDQAVWERECLEVEIPDDTAPNEVDDAVSEALDAGNYISVSDPEIQDAVEGIDTQTEIVDQHG